MDFIVENYMWFIIGGIVILMAVVGYIADITDFGRNRVEKEPKEKTEKPKKEKVKKEKIKKEKPNKNKVVQEVSLEPTAESENPVEINNELPMDEVQDIQPEQEIGFEQPNTDLESTMFSNEVNEMGNNVEDETVDQSLFEPLPSIDQVFQTANKPADDYTTPTTEPTMEESEVASDDDIWKF